MANKELAALTLKVDPEALRTIIASGRLLEFADTLATQAAAQISAQLVQQVATGALKADGLKGGVSAEMSFVSVIGDGEPGFGTVPRPPRFVVAPAAEVQQGALRQVAAVAGAESKG
jgi:hypothetical protein